MKRNITLLALETKWGLLGINGEVLERSKQFNSAPYGGFINPKYSLVNNEKGEITDVLIEYPNDFTTQMMDYAKDYSFLPHIN